MLGGVRRDCKRPPGRQCVSWQNGDYLFIWGPLICTMIDNRCESLPQGVHNIERDTRNNRRKSGQWWKTEEEEEFIHISWTCVLLLSHYRPGVWCQSQLTYLLHICSFSQNGSGPWQRKPLPHTKKNSRKGCPPPIPQDRKMAEEWRQVEDQKSSWEVYEVHSVQPNFKHKQNPSHTHTLNVKEKSSGELLPDKMIFSAWYVGRGGAFIHIVSEMVQTQMSNLCELDPVLCIQIPHWMPISDLQKGEMFARSLPGACWTPNAIVIGSMEGKRLPKQLLVTPTLQGCAIWQTQRSKQLSYVTLSANGVTFYWFVCHKGQWIIYYPCVWDGTVPELGEMKPIANDSAVVTFKKKITYPVAISDAVMCGISLSKFYKRQGT